MDFNVSISQGDVVKSNGRIEQRIHRFLYSFVPQRHLLDKDKDKSENGLEVSIHREEVGFGQNNRGNRLKTSKKIVSLVSENVGV